MKISIIPAFTAFAVAGLSIANAQVTELPAPTINPIYLPADYSNSVQDPLQSPAQPYGLNIVAPVQVSGSDAASTAFNAALPQLLNTIATRLPEQVNNASAGDFDPGKLVLDANYSVRAYFVSEGAGYHNTLGFNTTAPTTAGDITTSPDAKLIFPDASTPTVAGISNNTVQSITEPLIAGDFVDLGNFAKGTTLDFFLIAQGATNPSRTYYTETSFNQDGLVHAVGLAPSGSHYLLVSFEDLYGTGTTRDMNDVVVALEFRVAAPEPSLALGAALVGMFGLSIRRRSSR